MTIIKIAHRDTPYVTIRRETVQDETLSWEARGMLAYLLSKPLDWTVRPTQLQQCCGRDKVYGILRELSEHGYVTRTDKRDANGRVLEVEYMVYEVAENPIPFPEKPYTVNPNTDKHPLQIKELTEERLYTSPNGASNGNSEDPDSVSNHNVALDTPLGYSSLSGVKEIMDYIPLPAHENKEEGAAANGRATGKRKPNAVFDAIADARYHTHALDTRSAKFVGSLAAAAWDVYVSVRGEQLVNLAEDEKRTRCAAGVAAFELEWSKRKDNEGKALRAIKNAQSYATEFRTFLQEHTSRLPAPRPQAQANGSSAEQRPRSIFSTPRKAGGK